MRQIFGNVIEVPGRWGKSSAVCEQPRMLTCGIWSDMHDMMRARYFLWKKRTSWHEILPENHCQLCHSRIYKASKRDDESWSNIY